MPTRELNGPLIQVKPHPVDRDIVLVHLSVPESRLGPVIVRMTLAQAAKLADDLNEQVTP